MQLSLGDLLEGRYRIEAPIARGGMSTVYRSTDTRLGRMVAAKVMDDRYVGDPVFAERFQREARSMAQLSHPNLVGVYDFYSEGEHIFLIMELIDGGTLRELLAESGPMPAPLAMTIMRLVLTGLDAVHRAGMVHRDLKPDNVLINTNHQVKLSDFGLVRAASASNVTSNQIVGTVSYLSPEQVTGADITAASDVYSAGIVLFELLTGSTPFKGDSQISHAYARLDNDVPAPSSRIDGVPKLVDELVATATARNPKERFTDAAEFLSALDDVAAELHFPVVTVPVPHNAAAHRATTHIVSDDATEVVSPAAEDAPTKVHPGAAAAAGAAAASAQDSTPAPTSHMPQETSVFPPVAPQPAQPVQPAPQPVMQPAPPTMQQQLQPVAQNLPAPTPSSAAPVTNRGPARMVLWWIFVGLLTVSIAIGAWWFGSGRYGEVPQVLGMDKATAESTMLAAGFEVSYDTVYDNTTPIDLIAQTTPAGGDRAVKGDPVNLSVSLGKPSVPEFDSTAEPSVYQQALAQRTLTGTEGEGQYSDSVEAGKIVAVTPSPGSEVDTESTVTLHLSLGPAPANVPSVRDTETEQARTQLEEAGFKVKVVERFDDTIRGNHAIGTEPEAGSELPRGTEVTLLVSTAAEVPDLFGLTENEARSQLADAGIRVESVSVSSDSAAVGSKADEVYATQPAAGTLIDNSQTTVRIELVSQVEVPSVVGKKVSDARKTLQEAGFTVKLSSSATSSSRVLSQSPSRFETAAPGSEVELRTIN